jgi:hypothetical protein
MFIDSGTSITLLRRMFSETFATSSPPSWIWRPWPSRPYLQILSASRRRCRRRRCWSCSCSSSARRSLDLPQENYVIPQRNNSCIAILSSAEHARTLRHRR